MKTETFTKMINQYTGLLNQVKVFSNIEVTSLSVVEFNEKVEAAREYQAKLDAFNTDLYHIIGMANLSAAQMAQFTKLAKDINYHRTAVKSLAVRSPVALTPINDKPAYKLSCGVKLTFERKI